MPGRKGSKPVTPGVAWMSDVAADSCCNPLCGNPKFTFSHRRHHCRFCGKVFCDDCAPTVRLSPTAKVCLETVSDVRRCASCSLPRCFLPYRQAVGASLRGNGINAILSFLDNGSANNLLQSCRAMHRNFHAKDVPYFPTVKDRFPSLFAGAKIGKGGCGTVFRVEDRERKGCAVAVKIVDKASIYCYFVWRRLFGEIDIMRRNAHTNVASLYEVFQTPDEFVMVIEIGEGGSLRHAFDVVRRKKFSIEVFTAHVICQVAEALHYMYRENRVVHRDIKAENLVLSRDFSKVLVIDFGLAETVAPAPTGQQFVPCGTIGYASPENILAVVERKSWFSATGDIMHSSDIFSLGVVSFMMLGGTKPLKGTKFSDLHQEVKRGIRCEGPRWSDVSNDAKHLLEWMLASTVAARATVRDIASHPFIIKNKGRFTAFEAERKEELQSIDEQEADEWSFVGARGVTSWCLLDATEAGAASPPSASCKGSNGNIGETPSSSGVSAPSNGGDGRDGVAERSAVL